MRTSQQVQPKKLHFPCEEDALLNESQESYDLERKDFELKAQSPRYSFRKLAPVMFYKVNTRSFVLRLGSLKGVSIETKWTNRQRGKVGPSKKCVSKNF
jgi:hypothetical protein